MLFLFGRSGGRARSVTGAVNTVANHQFDFPFFQSWLFPFLFLSPIHDCYEYSSMLGVMRFVFCL